MKTLSTIKRKTLGENLGEIGLDISFILYIYIYIYIYIKYIFNTFLEYVINILVN